MKRSAKRRRTAKRARTAKRKRTIKYGGFRYGKNKSRTPIPGEVLISSPTTASRSRTRTRTRARKQSSWF